ncbi:class III extradiol ring-cleavage dioxygenase family protein [Salinifilum ghardaiensis]
MLSHIVVLPCPPLLVPELTVRSTPEVQQLRDACSRAVSSLTDEATEWVALGVDQSGERRCAAGTTGSFAGFGVDRVVTLSRERSAGRADRTLPLPVLVAGLLREQAGHRSVEVQLLGPDTSADRARRAGTALADGSGARALLVFADGSNRCDERSPYAPDPRAPAFDEHVRSLLATTDIAGLRELDAGAGGELGVPGVPALWAAAAAAERAGGEWDSQVEYSAAPFGVTYHVAVWRRALAV